MKSLPKNIKVGLVGNPNSGKSSVFNLLTGLHQKIGNFPGVTVDKKIGHFSLPNGQKIELIDFPGLYSLYPNSSDEQLVVNTLLDNKDENFPDILLYILDVTHFEKQLLLFHQLLDLGFPLILGLNMMDIAQQEEIHVQVDHLAQKLGVPVLKLSGRTGQGISEIKDSLQKIITSTPPPDHKPRSFTPKEQAAISISQKIYPTKNTYRSLLIAHHFQWLNFLSNQEKTKLRDALAQLSFESLRHQVDETMDRFEDIIPLAKKVIQGQAVSGNQLTIRLDRIFTNKILGPIIFFFIMFWVFQAIFSWASYPMNMIDGIFTWGSDTLKKIIPPGYFLDFLTDGLLSGIGGVLIFIPQIAILFFLIAILEEAGYMARVVFLFDRIMKFFGLSGRSIIALISSSACAIPAIMSTRTITNWKERLTTIFITPFMSCSARIPVYAMLIGFAFPSKVVGGWFNLQGLAFMGLYLLGLLGALFTALIFKLVFKSNERSYLTLELPEYRAPVMRNVFYSVWGKVRTFVTEAGKIIIIISIILWGMANFGRPGHINQAQKTAKIEAQSQGLNPNQTEALIASKSLEASFAGDFGKAIEPIVKPLGFDWKIGIALITSFAAREVFVGTISTIYSIESTEELSIRERLATERNPQTGELVYSIATSSSLLIFYVFAMMCMSTLAVVKRETGSWKWPIIQFFVMTGLAYGLSFITYTLLS